MAQSRTPKIETDLPTCGFALGRRRRSSHPGFKEERVVLEHLTPEERSFAAYGKLTFKFHFDDSVD